MVALYTNFQVPNQFGPLIKVVAEVVEENFRKSHYFPKKFLIFLVVTEDFLTKVVGKAVIFNLKKVITEDFLKKVVGGAVSVYIKKSLKKIY